jgi:hypothetical protein
MRSPRTSRRTAPERDGRGRFRARPASSVGPGGDAGAPIPPDPPAPPLEALEPFEPEPVLIVMQRLFREADVPTKRAFWSWVLEYAQLHADQGLRDEF